MIILLQIVESLFVVLPYDRTVAVSVVPSRICLVLWPVANNK